MLSPEFESLKQAALAAQGKTMLSKEGCTFYDTANPTAILALLAQLEAAQEAPDELLTSAKHEIARLKEELHYYTRTENPAIKNPAGHYQLERAFDGIGYEGVSTLPSTPLPGEAQLESAAEKFYAIRKEYDEYMSDSFAQQVGVSFANWKLRYKVAAPGEPGQ